ncbi:MAG: TIR domain-containing protein, partial [Nonomuraea sp.]|nr:TIR domain-containing protein [Nonomuraea sp.]
MALLGERGKPAPGHYDGFISYSRAADGRLGPALRDALHQFARPWHRLRALRVFCDARSLSASPGLWTTIEAALDASRCFVLLASPDSARSVWVRREVERWRSLVPERPMLIVVTGGEIAWDHEAGRFDAALTTALPEMLLQGFTEAPLWVDLRSIRTETDLSLGNPAFLDTVATLASALHQRPKDELVGEDVRQHRRARRFRRSSWTGLSLLTVAALVGAVAAVDSAGVARAQRDRAEAQHRSAVSSLLVARRDQVAAGDPVLAGLLAATAWTFEQTPEARHGMLASLATPARGVVHGLGPARALGPDGEVLAGDRTTRLWDPATRAWTGGPFSETFRSARFGRDGRTLVTLGEDGDVRLWDAATWRQLGTTFAGPGDVVSALDLSPDGRTLVTVGFDHKIQRWDTTTWRQVGTPLTGHTDTVESLSVSPDGRTLASAGIDGGRLWDLAAGRGKPLSGHTGEIRSTAFSPDGTILATGGQNGDVRLWDSATGHSVGGPLRGHDDPVGTLAFSPDGRTLATGSWDTTVRLWDVASGRPVGDPLTGHDTQVTGVAFSAGGRLLVSTSTDGTVRLWDPAARRPVTAPLKGHTAEVTPLLFAPDGRSLFSGGQEGTVRLWDPA